MELHPHVFACVLHDNVIVETHAILKMHPCPKTARMPLHVSPAVICTLFLDLHVDTEIPVEITTSLHIVHVRHKMHLNPRLACQARTAQNASQSKTCMPGTNHARQDLQAGRLF